MRLILALTAWGTSSRENLYVPLMGWSARQLIDTRVHQYRSTSQQLMTERHHSRVCSTHTLTSDHDCLVSRLTS